MPEKKLPVSGYEKLNHPIQQEILQYVAKLSEVPIKQIVSAVDGCGVPVHAIPLKKYSDLLFEVRKAEFVEQ